MQAIYCMLMLLSLCICGTDSQRDDTNPNRFVPRADAWDKAPRCEIYQYFEFVDPDTGVNMVDRSKFLMVFNSMRYELDCAPGTLFSIQPNLCVCSTAFHLINQDNEVRCISIDGDLQGDTNHFNRIQDGIPSTAYVEDFYNMRASSSLNCYVTDSLVHPYIPFFAANSFTHNTFDMTIGFYLGPAASFTNQDFTLVSNSPCSTNNQTASATLFLRNDNDVWSLRLVFRMRDLWVPQKDDVEFLGTVECTLNPIVTLAGNLPWTVTDPTNLVHVAGNIDDFNNIQIDALNGASGNQAGVNDIPPGGYCQGTTPRLSGRGASGARRIVAERDCPLDLGPRIPTGFEMCISTVRITRDC